MYAASLQALQAATTVHPTISSQKKRSGDRRSINGDSQTQTSLVRRRRKNLELVLLWVIRPPQLVHHRQLQPQL